MKTIIFTLLIIVSSMAMGQVTIIKSIDYKGKSCKDLYYKMHKNTYDFQAGEGIVEFSVYFNKASIVKGSIDIVAVPYKGDYPDKDKLEDIVIGYLKSKYKLTDSDFKKELIIQ